MKIQSHAKVNLWLHVTGKREDGYHTLNTLMCRIGLCDTITLERGGEGIRVSCDYPGVPEDAGNLVYRAADLFYSRLKETAGIRIAIEKKIPVGAGLGGGSSNAAAVLCGLNRLAGTPFSASELREMGLCLGADVPFFIEGRAALATGVGEVLTPFTGISPWKVLLVYPGFSVSTARVFKKLKFDLTKAEKKIKGSSLNNGGSQNPSIGPFDPARHLRNDLEPATARMHPGIHEVKRAISRNGAAGSLMSGSGSAVFGLFSDGDRAAEAARILSDLGKPGWKVFLTDLVL